MSRKVVEYVGWLHTLKDRVKESWTQFWHSESEGKKESNSNFRQKVKDKLEKLSQQTITRINHSSNTDEGDYSHLTRSKTRGELVKISAAVMGIEFSYAAETAFVSPLLLNIGLRHRHMTLMWCLSPLLGFFLTPLLGSLSDGCRPRFALARLGKRRPFIILLSIGIVLGLILVPNGKAIGLFLGDTYKENRVAVKPLDGTTIPTTMMEKRLSSQDENQIQSLGELKELVDSERMTKNKSSVSFNPLDEMLPPSYKKTPRHWVFDESGRRNNYYTGHQVDEREEQDVLKNFKRNPLSKLKENSLDNLFKEAIFEIQQGNESNIISDKMDGQSTPPPQNINDSTYLDHSHNQSSPDSISNHPWGLVFTIIGTVLLDFDADACQSPARAFMLDVTIPEDHTRGLSTFTIMAGLGGCLGYILGALNWENNFIGTFFGGQVRAVFTLVLFIFIGCVITTIRSFREIPIDRLWTNKPSDRKEGADYTRFEDEKNNEEERTRTGSNYGTIVITEQETSFNENPDVNYRQSDLPLEVEEAVEKLPTFREYIKTTVQLPKSLQWLCVTNFFCWMSLVCYSLYFTDFVGEAVYGGDPTAPIGSISRTNYEEGVRFGCWGMSLYSLSCSIYSFAIEKLVQKFGAKRVYICGQLVYSVGMVCMAIFRHPAGVIIFSWTAGIMYATLFTMPYLLVARYHAAETFDVDELVRKPSQMRGLGTDVAIVSSMVFLAQMTQALTLGSVVAAAGTTTAIVCAAAVFASCGALSATKVLYLDL